MAELKTFKIKLKRLDEVVEFDLKEPLWIDDRAIQRLCTNQSGQLVESDLWMRRLESATGRPDSELRKMPNWILDALIIKWLELFEPQPGTFLENSQEAEKSISENSISAKPGST